MVVSRRIRGVDKKPKPIEDQLAFERRRRPRVKKYVAGRIEEWESIQAEIEKVIQHIRRLPQR